MNQIPRRTIVIFFLADIQAAPTLNCFSEIKSLYSVNCVLFGSKRKLIDLPAQGKIKILYLFI